MAISLGGRTSAERKGRRDDNSAEVGLRVTGSSHTFKDHVPGVLEGQTSPEEKHWFRMQRFFVDVIGMVSADFDMYAF